MFFWTLVVWREKLTRDNPFADRFGHRQRVQSGADVCLGARRHARDPRFAGRSFPRFFCDFSLTEPSLAARDYSRQYRALDFHRSSSQDPRGRECCLVISPANSAEQVDPLQDITVKKTTDEIHIVAHHTNAEDRMPAYRRIMWLRRVLPGIAVKVSVRLAREPLAARN